MEEITIFNWVHLAGLIIILSFLAKHHHDSRKGQKLLLQEMRGTRNEMQGVRKEMQGVRNEMQGVHKEIHESESGLIGKLCPVAKSIF